jgi:hypothetical protein
MFTLTGLFVGLAMATIGILGVKYTFWIHNQTGPVSFIERYAGSGSTYGVFKILFALLVLVGIIWATGFGRNVMSFLFSPFLSLFIPKQ